MATTKQQDAHSRPGLPTHIAKVFAAVCLVVGFHKPMVGTHLEAS